MNNKTQAASIPAPVDREAIAKAMAIADRFGFECDKERAGEFYDTGLHDFFPEDDLTTHHNEAEITTRGKNHWRKMTDLVLALLPVGTGDAEAVRGAAEAFRIAVIESGALNHVSQDKYFDKLRALETAIASANPSSSNAEQVALR